VWVPERVEGLFSQERGQGLALKIIRLGKLYWSGNVVISKVDSLMYVVLSKPERHVSYGRLVCTTHSLCSFYIL